MKRKCPFCGKLRERQEGCSAMAAIKYEVTGSALLKVKLYHDSGCRKCVEHIVKGMQQGAVKAAREL